MKKFKNCVLNVVAKIPKGKTKTYSEVASACGSPRAYRAVGNILHQNYRSKNLQLPIIDVKVIPCHRVIRADGSAGGYAEKVEKKIELLRQEGVKISHHKIFTKRTLKKKGK